MITRNSILSDLKEERLNEVVAITEVAGGRKPRRRYRGESKTTGSKIFEK